MIGKNHMSEAGKRICTCCRTFFALLAISMLSVFVSVTMVETGGWSYFSRTALVSHADEIPQQSILSSVPSGTDLVVAVDVERLLEVGFVREGLEEAKEDAYMGELQELLDKYGIELKDIGKEFVLFADEDSAEGGLSGVVLRTVIEEARFKEILEAESEENAFNYETIEVGDYEAYLLTEYRKGNSSGQAGAAPGQMMPEKAAVTYLTPNHMLITGGAHIEGVIESIGEGRNLAEHPHPRMQDIDREALVWGVYERSKNDSAAAGTGENFWEGIMGLNFDINLTGEEQQDFRFRLSTESASAESARNMHQQAVMLSQLMLPMFFQDDPDTAQKLMQAIEIELSGKEVNFSVSLERELIEALQKFIGAQRQQEAQ